MSNCVLHLVMSLVHNVQHILLQLQENGAHKFCKGAEVAEEKILISECKPINYITICQIVEYVCLLWRSSVVFVLILKIERLELTDRQLAIILENWFFFYKKMKKSLILCYPMKLFYTLDLVYKWLTWIRNFYNTIRTNDTTKKMNEFQVILHELCV